MIPLQLRISGFLSYCEPVELDFTSFELACISGQNGAGKSSLLDAMTWALFGQARKRDDSLINLRSKAAEVTFNFEYEGDVYRSRRARPRGKATVLEFQILDGRPLTMDRDSRPSSSVNGRWRPLTERTLRGTQARIEQTLRMDYETFVNAAFFLQGKADQFTQQTAGKRKDVLGNILGLEMWETYKVRTAERRKSLEEQVNGIDGRIVEIDAELAEEDQRKQHLSELESELNGLTSARRAQESALENIKKAAASLGQLRKLVKTLADGLERSRARLSGLCNRLAEREAVRAADAELVGRANEVESAYKAWQERRKELEQWDKVASQFREHEKDRAPLLEQIAAEKARLEEERRGLLVEQEAISDQGSAIENLKSEIDGAKQQLIETEGKVVRRRQLEEDRNAAREKQAELKAENEALKAEMDELKTRIDRLETADGASCPLCGQPLSAQHRKSTLKQLKAEGKEKGDRFRANKVSMDELSANLKETESKIGTLSSAGDEQLAYSNSIAQLTERMERLQSLAKDWDLAGRKRLKEVEKNLENGKYATEFQKQLAKLDKERAKLGYDAAAHDAAPDASGPVVAEALAMAGGMGGTVDLLWRLGEAQPSLTAQLISTAPGLLRPAEEVPRVLEGGSHAAMPFRNVVHGRAEEVEATFDLARDVRAGEHCGPRAGQL